MGYDAQGFTYYETQGKDLHVKGERGIHITTEDVLQAVRAFSARYKLPWTYMLTTVAPGPITATRAQALVRNGEELIGTLQGPIALGAEGLVALAKGMEKDADKLSKEPRVVAHLRSLLMTMVDFRGEMVLHMERQSVAPIAAQALKAHVALLTRAAEELASDIRRSAGTLREAAQAQHEAGKAMIHASKAP